MQDIDYRTETAYGAIVGILFGLVLHPVVILVLIAGFPETVLRMIKVGYPLRVFLVIYTVITVSWPGLLLTLLPSLQWMLAGSIRIQTNGSRLHITARKDDFETEASCVERVWAEWGGPWTAGGWGGNQLLFWRRYALLIRVRENGVVRDLAFPLFNVADGQREHIVQDLSNWFEKARAES